MPIIKLKELHLYAFLNIQHFSSLALLIKSYKHETILFVLEIGGKHPLKFTES